MMRAAWFGGVIRCLIAALALAATPMARGESDQQLVNRFDQAEAKGEFEVALSAALAIVQRHPESGFWAFNAARMQARLGHPDEAIALLQTCADRGFAGISSVEQHADLDSIRSRPEYAVILAKVRANAQKRLDAFKAEAMNHKPSVYVPRSLAKDAKAPVIIALHGSGGVGSQMSNALRKTCDTMGMICIAPDALRPDGNGFSWTYRDESEWMVERMIEVAVKEYNGDPERVYLVGFSQGANIALVMTQTHAKEFAGVVPVCGHYEANITADTKTIAPTYLLTGARDPWKETYEAAKADFTKAGARSEVRIVPGMGHEMANTGELIRALEWCAAAKAEPGAGG